MPAIARMNSDAAISGQEIQSPVSVVSELGVRVKIPTRSQKAIQVVGPSCRNDALVDGAKAPDSLRTLNAAPKPELFHGCSPPFYSGS